MSTGCWPSCDCPPQALAPVAPLGESGLAGAPDAPRPLRPQPPPGQAYLLKEQLAHLWTYTYEGAARRFLTTWLLALRWQRLPAFQKLGRMLTRHLDGILNYCHEKVPFGKVEAINGNIRAMLRRGRGYRDHEYLLLKVQKATAERRRLLRAA
ncbi:MAG: transposase [Candidatus Rokubacteria bacterium]|nr:transposase [Candidatus Rokubacteria bacterium]